MKPLARFFAGALALTTFAICVMSCTAVIGINGDYEDIATTYCQCPKPEMAFGGNCAGYVRGQLARDAAKAQTWLKAYGDEGCDNCENALRCASLSPVCYDFDHSCTDANTCCGYTEGRAGCANGVCTHCVGEQQACTTSAECCTGTYCGQHGDTKNLCIRENPNCHHTGGLCQSAGDCCGFEDGADANTDVSCKAGRCEEHCKLSAPDNCPNCCLSALIGGTDAVGICGDGSPQCASRCDPGSTATTCLGMLKCNCHDFAAVPNSCAYTCQVGN